MSFVRAPNPIWFMVDLIGLPLNDEYYAFFLTNTLPYLPQNVYRDPQGLTVWTGDIVQFFPNGTLPDNLYFDPSLVYRIEIRHGNLQSSPLIYEINNFVPEEGEGEEEIFTNANQVSNGQFSLVNFVTPLTITAAGTHAIAPGWDLVLTGPGTSSILSQIILSGDGEQITNPPYALRIANSGWETAQLIQTFNNNGALWAAGAVTMSIVAHATGSSELISLVYHPSVGVDTTVASANISTGSFQVLKGGINLPASTNSDLSTVAFVQMIIDLPENGTVDISNVQMIGQSSPLPSSPAISDDVPDYQQESNERMIDHLFHYYKSQLLIKPKDNILVGWNFPLNPYQGTDLSVLTQPTITSYIADQTILHQELASQLQRSRNSVAERQNLLIKAVTAATKTRFALIQYIDPSSIKPYWSYILSSFVRARIFTDAASSVRLKCRLIYRTSLPPSISNTEPIASWAANSDPTFAAGWSALIPLNDPAYVLLNSYSTDESLGANSYPSFSFDNFQLPNSSNANMTLGIVIYTMDNLNSVAGHEDSIAFDRVSLIPSYFGADAAPESFDESLRRCQFYYEQSYEPYIFQGAVTSVGVKHFISPLVGDGTTFCNLYRSPFPIIFKQQKRIAPAIRFFDQAGTADKIDMTSFDGTTYPVAASGSNPAVVASSAWTVFSTSTSNVIYYANGGTAIMGFLIAQASLQGNTLFHYVADARLGI